MTAPRTDGEMLPRIEAIDLASPGTLAGDFVAGKGAARALLAPLPTTATPTAPPGERAKLTAAEFTLSSAGATSRLERILAGEGEFVTTGQQPGLFLGPLYSLYKAVTAIRIAEARERDTGRPTLALFWVAADDHDWAEVASCRVLDPDEELVELRVHPTEGREERSVGETALPPEVEAELARLRRSSRGPATGTPAPWFGDLEAAYRPGTTFAAAFIRGLAGALAGQEIAFLDSSAPAVRRAAADLYRRIFGAPGRVTGAMATGRARLEEAGYSPTLTPPAAGLQVFFDAGAGRRHVLATDDGFDVGDDTHVDVGELRALLDDSPGAFTPAAALRPALESALLPVAATVLGPGEVSYWAQLPPLFAALGVQFPAIHPRDSWLLVEAAVDHLLGKLDVTAAEVAQRGDGLTARWIDGARPPGVAAALERTEADLRASFDRLEEAAAVDLPGLRSAAAKASHGAEKAISELRKTIDAHVAERESIALGQLERLNAHLRPAGHAQERTVAAAQFLGRYGEGLVAALLAASRVAGVEGRG